MEYGGGSYVQNLDDMVDIEVYDMRMTITGENRCTSPCCCCLCRTLQPFNAT